MMFAKQCSESALFKFNMHKNHLWFLLNSDCNSAGPSWGLIFISNKVSSNAAHDHILSSNWLDYLSGSLYLYFPVILKCLMEIVPYHP